MQAMPAQRLITEMGSNVGIFGMTPEQEMALGAMMLWSNSNPYYYANVKNTTKFDYIMIPVLAQYGWDVGQSPWRLYVNAGPFVSFLLSGKQVTQGNSKLFSDTSGTTTVWDMMPEEAKYLVAEGFPDIERTLNETVAFGETNITGEMKSVNFGVAANVGIRYQYNRNYFFLEAGGNYGFIPVQKNDTNGNNRLSAVSVMLGYAFSLF